jgi:hypothetical protein
VTECSRTGTRSPRQLDTFLLTRIRSKGPGVGNAPLASLLKGFRCTRGKSLIIGGNLGFFGTCCVPEFHDRHALLFTSSHSSPQIALPVLSTAPAAIATDSDKLTKKTRIEQEPSEYSSPRICLNSQEL